MSSETDRLFLLDGMALAYRAHFALISRPLINSKGLDTSAIFGFTGALFQLLENENPEHIAVVFDVMGPGGTFRDQLFEDYKAHRPPMPEPLQAAIPIIKEIVRAFDIPVLENADVEADDVIGTVAKKAEEEGIHTIIVSPDKDFRQLLSPLISILRPARQGESFDMMTDVTFKEEYGVDPVKFIDILALLGDAADNVPGVPGIGAKTAPALIAEYGSVENLLEHAESFKAKRVREGLMNNPEMALLSKKLVTILTDVPLGFDWHELKRSLPHQQRLVELMEELEFRRFRERAIQYAVKLGGGQPVAGTQTSLFDDSSNGGVPAEESSFDADAVAYKLVGSSGSLETEISALKEAKVVAFDTETTSVDPMWASLVGCSFSAEEGKAWYAPFPAPDGTPDDDWFAAMKRVLEDETIAKIGQNIKYDLLVMRRHGVEVKGPLFDTMVAHYLLAPDGLHNMDALARQYLNYSPIPISSLIGSGKEQRSMRDLPPSEVSDYASEDADITFRLASILKSELEKNELTEIAEKIEFPLIPVLAEMEHTGVRIDVEMLSEISQLLGDRIETLASDIFEAAGEEFNIGSPKQIGVILFEKMGLPVKHKTAKGQPSTNERVLSELATEHGLPAMIIDWRKISKLKNTYVDSLPGLVHPETGRLHSNFNQTVAATGRLSSSNPNLQNIPIRSGDGREIRRAFIAADGYQLMSADYAQIELRIIASMSGDEGLIEAFEKGWDIHTAAASRIFKIDPDQVTRTQRNRAKEVNYGIPYGISANGLSQRMRIPLDEAKALIKGYQTSYPGITSFIRHLVDTARETGFACTLMGRRRYVPDIKARNPRLRSAAERISVNMPIQGTQADMIKMAMIKIHDRIIAEKLKSRMILQVHDELLFEIWNGEEDQMTLLVKQEMEQALTLKVPVLVEYGIGKNWLDVH